MYLHLILTGITYEVGIILSNFQMRKQRLRGTNKPLFVHGSDTTVPLLFSPKENAIF